MAEPEAPATPLAEALARVGDRWTLLIVEALLAGPLRFNDLADQIPGIAASILSERLKRLERDALVIARPYSDRPPRAAYQLTAEGTDLAGAVRLLAGWAARHTDATQTPRHTACGTPLQARWYCPTCDHLADHEPDADTLYALPRTAALAAKRDQQTNSSAPASAYSVRWAWFRPGW